MSDKLISLIPTSVDFYDGESPTATKLEGIAREQKQAIEVLEYIIGDPYGYSSIKPNSWINNFSRDIGDRDKLSPLQEPGVILTSYVQNLVVGKNCHELDLIPVGTGASIISSSTDASIVPGQFKSSVSLLNTIGDWTLVVSSVEQGITKNSRRLITYAPSDGHTITFAQVTSGRGDAFYWAKNNVIPSVAQAEQGGPFCAVTLIDAINNIYEIILPINSYTSDRIHGATTTTISNTKAAVASDRQHELPAYLFDPTGLDLYVTDPLSGEGKIYPLGSLRIYDYDIGEIVDGLIQIQAAFVQGQRKYKILCTFADGVILNTVSGHYCVACSGTSISELLSSLKNELFNHNHNADDLIRQIDHSTLMNLRTGGTFANLSDWYGASNLSGNDHSQYLHRDGYRVTDIGSGYNILRGDLLIGSTVTGTGTPNYNLTSDSYGLRFGNNLGPTIGYDLSFIQTIPFAHGVVPASFDDKVLKLISPTGTSFNTSAIVGDLRITENVVLGSDADNDVIIPGDLYVDNSFILRPRADKPTAEEGQFIYDSNLNAPAYYNGSNFVTLGIYPYSAIVGSTFNATHTDLQTAIDAVPAGSRILITSNLTLLSEVDVDKDSLMIEAMSSEVIITGGDFTGLNITGDKCKIKGLNLRSFTGTNGRAIYIDSEGIIVSDTYFDPSNTLDWEVEATVTQFKIYGSMSL
jgi:hypothetical protein